MGGNQSLLNDVTNVFNKGNKKYLEGDLVAAKMNFFKCLIFTIFTTFTILWQRLTNHDPLKTVVLWGVKLLLTTP